MTLTFVPVRWILALFTGVCFFLPPPLLRPIPVLWSPRVYPRVRDAWDVVAIASFDPCVLPLPSLASRDVWIILNKPDLLRLGHDGSVLLMVLFSWLSVVGLSAEERTRPLSACRRVWTYPARFFCRATMFIFGFWWISEVCGPWLLRCDAGFRSHAWRFSLV